MISIKLAALGLVDRLTATMPTAKAVISARTASGYLNWYYENGAIGNLGNPNYTDFLKWYYDNGQIAYIGTSKKVEYLNHYYRNSQQAGRITSGQKLDPVRIVIFITGSSCQPGNFHSLCAATGSP